MIYKFKKNKNLKKKTMTMKKKIYLCCYKENSNKNIKKFNINKK